MNNGYFSIGQIADLLEEPPARVAYMIRKHRIKASYRVGIIRLFSSEQVDSLRPLVEELNRRKKRVKDIKQFIKTVKERIES